MEEEERNEEIEQEPAIAPTQPTAAVEEEEEKEDDISDVFIVEREDISDLAEVTEEDVMGEDDADMSDDVLELPEEEDMSDLFEAGDGSVVSPAKKGKPKKTRRVKATPRYYTPAIGGMSRINQ